MIVLPSGVMCRRCIIIFSIAAYVSALKYDSLRILIFPHSGTLTNQSEANAKLYSADHSDSPAHFKRRKSVPIRDEVFTTSSYHSFYGCIRGKKMRGRMILYATRLRRGRVANKGG